MFSLLCGVVFGCSGLYGMTVAASARYECKSASNWAGYLSGNTAVTGIPAFFPQAAAATGIPSFNCFTGAVGGVLRGIFSTGFGL